MVTTCHWLRIQGCVQLKILLGSLNDVVQFTFRSKAANDLILWWHVKFFHYAVKFLAKFGILLIKLGNRSVLLCEQESQILYFVHRLSALGLPLEVCTISMLLSLDQLKVKRVVLFHKTFIFFLKRRHRLRIQTCFLCDTCVVVLKLLKCFSRLHHFIEESLDESCRLDIYAERRWISWNMRSNQGPSSNTIDYFWWRLAPEVSYLLNG